MVEIIVSKTQVLFRLKLVFLFRSDHRIYNVYYNAFEHNTNYNWPEETLTSLSSEFSSSEI